VYVSVEWDCWIFFEAKQWVSQLYIFHFIYIL
jgi:hypothetical protein